MSIAFYISLFLLLIVAIRTLVVLFNYLTRPILPNEKAERTNLISILIPARNEEGTIGNLLIDLSEQTHRNIEVIVYDDGSTDGTREVVEDHIRTDPNVRLIDGHTLPSGWLGKNHACHTLAQYAKGDYLLFLDADVRVAPWFIHNALAYVHKRRLSLLSIFPNQIMGSLGELLVVPSMNWILLSLLPIRFVRWSKRRSLAAANGQMMMFEANSYRENQWHMQVKDRIAEDICIARQLKRKKERMATLLGTNDIYCRMYSSYNDAVQGFAKNIPAFFGGSSIFASIFVAVGLFAPALVTLYLPFPLAFIYISSMLLSRMLVAKLSSQSVLLNVLLWPAQHFALIQIVIGAITARRGKTLLWKGRKLID